VVTPSHDSNSSLITPDDASQRASTVSALTASVRTAGTSRAGTFVPNPHGDINLQRLVPFNMKIRDLMGSASPPLNDDNLPMCLSFHVKGGCFSNCRRRADHTRPLTAADKDRLRNYIADRLAAAPMAPPSVTP
jgi:hypothetical protein